MAIAKRTQPESAAKNESRLHEAEAQRRQMLEQEQARIRQLAEKRGQNEYSIMEGLVEGDLQPRALKKIAADALAVSEWYLRFMVVEKLGRQVLLDVDYTKDELQSWLTPFALEDSNSYIRRAAIKHLTDLTALAKASSEDAEPCVRSKAVERLFCFLDTPEALEALNRVTLQDPEPALRHMAVKRIVDQSVLAKAAKEDAEPEIRKSATEKLSGQDDLAWVLLNDSSVLVRSAAAERMTDVKALVQAAAKVSIPQLPAAPAADPAAMLEELDKTIE
ncbi:MAG: hypothetical protein LBQ33_02875 [Oscillospiraceae bacterium]|jgi:hypothetical protein|nr:hypothetical protein [Oscillospiraceae bacterium]